MNGFPWLTLAGAIPLAGALAVALVPTLPADSAPADIAARSRLVKVLALAFTVVTLIWVIVMATRFNPSGPAYQLNEVYSWIPAFGVHYAVGVDGLVNTIAATIGGSSGRLRRVQTGFVRSYALSMLIGAVLLVGALLLVRI